ncbi:LOW QUALITY PROTEIN: zinc finger protein 366-like [Strigops habroptila]|uniref:LOW QUALITY PROTEIN: zinc finger protein 366-like n=1 Tax=Strigops habroptila TaxID=2489341 RepID=UPI0011CFD5EF|nr:LOW QUALITY PROTEIN: zinc finger protein 366-like [Strigops habroptila]
MMKNEETSFNVDSPQASPFSCCLQPLSPVTKPHTMTPFDEEFRPHLSHFHYGPPPLGDMETFQGSLEGGSQKCKSMPTKMPPPIILEGSSSPADRPENHNDIGSSSLPLVFQQPAQPKYSSQMIDLCNLGFQFYRTLEHFGAKPIKQEPAMPNMASPVAQQPSSPAFMQVPYPYYPKVHPGLMFPFTEAQNFHFRNPFQMKRPPEAPFRRAEVRGSGENKQKVERVDVNLQIDNSYYVNVGGEQKHWQCPMCAKSYTSKYNLVTHILEHSGIKPHACIQCGKLFKQLSHLHTHMLTHQGTRPHKCQVCHKAFTLSWLCGKEFNRMHNLMGRMHLHSDSKPFKCLYCPSKFTLKGNLTRHVKVKHSIMERGFNSQVFGRRKISLSQKNVWRSLEQEEPFDLSQKSQGKGISFNLNGRSAKGSSCQEEGEDNAMYETEHYSPGMCHHDNNKLYDVAQDLSGKPECAMKDCIEKEEMLCEGGLEKRIGNSDKQDSQEERDLANDKEHLSFRSFEEVRLSRSLSDYL